LYFNVFMIFVGYGSTLMTIVNFAKHSAYASAAMLCVITLTCIRLQMVFVRDVAQLQLEVANSLKTGFLQPLLRHWMAITVASKHAFTVIIVAFSSLFVVESQTACVLQMGSYSLSVWTIVCADVNAHLGEDLCQVGDALVRRYECGSAKLLLLTFWSGCHVAGSIALNSLVMKQWHPLLALSLFVPCGWVKFAKVQVPWWKKVYMFFTEPIESLTFAGSSVFGFPCFVTSLMQYGDPPNVGNRPALPLVGANIFRYVVSVAFVAQHIKGFVGSKWSDCFEGVLSGGEMFEAFLIAQVLLSVPVDIAAMVFQTVNNHRWRDGIENGEAAAVMLEVGDALILFEDDE